MANYHDDIFVYFFPLPTGAKEFIMPCSGGFTVYINSKLDAAKRLEAYNHAVWHIEHDDWQKLSVQRIEYEAHK